MSGDPFEDGARGAWRGFYVYEPGGRRHAMRLELAFANGRVTGSGSDDVGRFTVDGGFDAEGVRVWWRKDYAGAHTVWYDGARDGARSRVVYGAWRIAGYDPGGFRIWRGDEDADVVVAAERVAEPVGAR